MRKILIAILVIGGLVSASAQATFGIRASFSPGSDPNTDHLIVNRGEAGESLFNVNKIKPMGQIGLTARYDLPMFYFAGELNYGMSSIEYSMISTQLYLESPPGEGLSIYQVRTGSLQLPVTAGVKLGVVEIFSGLYLQADIHEKNDLKQLEGYRDDSHAFRPGWISGVGVHVGNFLVDVRYQQEFSNYGEGQYLNDQEMLLKSAPGRFVASAAFMF